MKRAEFEKATFEEVIEKLIDEGNNITTYDELVDFARECIDNREFNLAINILEVLRDDESEYYEYDYSMGTLETPCGLNEKEHVEHLIEDDED